jgi:hypothetical protein
MLQASQEAVMTDPTSKQDQDSAKGRERSPNYPALLLSEAIALAEALWKKEKRTPVPPEVAVRAWDYKGLSGAARSTLGGMRQYGLVEDTQHGVRLSQTAMEILHQPAGSAERANAIASAAMTPKLFRELAGTHAEASDDAIRAHLLTRRNFTDDAARRFVRSFREAVKLANPAPSGYSSSEMTPTEIEQPDALDGSEMLRNLGQVFKKPKVTLFSWPLGTGQIAEVRFIGEDVKPDQIELLKDYLNVAKRAVSAGMTPEAPANPT